MMTTATLPIPTPTIQQLRNLRKTHGEQAPEIIGGFLNLDELTAAEREFLSVCLRIVREDHGSESPGESFLRQLIGRYGQRALTPEAIANLIEDFELDFQCAIRDARKLVAEYPDLLAPEGTVQ